MMGDRAAPEMPIHIGFDKDGDEHEIAAERNLHHTADTQCGCNPDAYNTENPFRAESGVWVWYHHPFEDEL